MYDPDYIGSINENLGTYYLGIEGPKVFTSTQDLKNYIVGEPVSLYVLGTLARFIDSGFDKEGYDSGTGFVVFTLGEMTLKLEYHYSSWDDTEHLDNDLYYVEREEEEIVKKVYSYKRLS